MKKLFISLLFLFLILPTSVFAADNDFSVYSKDNAITKIETKLDIKDSVLVLYNEDKTVSSMHSVKFNDGSANTIIKLPENNYFAKIYYDIGTDNSYLLYPYNIKEMPKEDELEFEDIYPSGAAAIGALAVIKSADKTVTYDDEIINRIVCLYQGKEIVIDLEEDIRVTAQAPEVAIYDGMDISNLKEGDIVYFTAYLNGNIYKVNFLFRPYQTDIITENNNIVFGPYQSNFKTYGVIVERLKNGTVVLYDKTGLEKNALYLGLHKNAPVYVYDMSKRKDKVSIGTSADIIKSEIIPSEMDDDNNILSWGADNSRNYAYVRVYNGDICDIVVFANYNL